MDIMKLKENAQLFLKMEKQMKRLFNENNKLQKQRGVANSLYVFINHYVFNQAYVITYVQAYDGQVDELHFQELSALINPKLYESGVFLISKHKGPVSDGDASDTDSGPLNSTDIYNTSKTSNDFTSSIDLHVRTNEYVNCGTIFSTSNIMSGGKREFHGTLGLCKNVSLSMKDLHPLSITDARYFCAMYSQSIQLCSEINNTTLIIPCQSFKPLNIATMICYPETIEVGKNFLHIVQIQDSNGALDNNEKKHVDVIESTYSSVYDILGDLQIEGSESENEASLKIYFSWSGSGYQLFQHPPNAAKTVLQLQVTVGDTRSAVHDVFLELTALDSIINNSQFSSSQVFGNVTNEKLYEKLLLFKESVSDFSFYGNIETKQNAKEETDDLETPMSQLIQHIFQRSDHDFTDKLWIYLRQTEGSVDDIRASLDNILMSIIDGSLQPAISTSNETKLAKYIRRMYLAENDEVKSHMKEKILEFLSSEQAVLNLVGEIGFEKLRKDYFNFFLNKELSSFTNLRQLCENITGAFDTTALWKLHFCLELVITPAIYLNLAHDCQCTLLKAGIDYYSVNEVQSCSPIFCLSLLPFHDSSLSIYQTCEARHPVIWQHGSVQLNKADAKEIHILYLSNKTVMPDDDQLDYSPTQIESKVLYDEVVVLPLKGRN